MKKQNANILPAGTLLNNGKYVIEQELGHGTFGITYKAKCKTDGKEDCYVAIKEFFMSEVNGRKGTRVTSAAQSGLFDHYKKKFLKESRHLSELSHPGIVTVSEAFEENNTGYYVMEIIDGGSLDEYIVKNNGLDDDKILELSMKICEALNYMHSKGMLHLDLKPSNIMMKDEQTPVLIDFGLSKKVDKDGNAESTTSMGAGTQGYAPTEQMWVDGDAKFAPTMDIYALGATMYKMVTAKIPPASSAVMQYGLPAFQRESVLRGIIEKAMCPAKEGRYQAAKIMYDALYASTLDEVTVVVVKQGGGNTDNGDTVYQYYNNGFYPGGMQVQSSGQQVNSPFGAYHERMSGLSYQDPNGHVDSKVVEERKSLGYEEEEEGGSNMKLFVICLIAGVVIGFLAVLFFDSVNYTSSPPAEVYDSAAYEAPQADSLQTLP